jgi:hypothetical protein
MPGNGHVRFEQHDEWTEQRGYLGLENLGQEPPQDLTRTPTTPRR